MGSLHMTIQTAVLIETLDELGQMLDGAPVTLLYRSCAITIAESGSTKSFCLGRRKLEYGLHSVL